METINSPLSSKQSIKTSWSLDLRSLSLFRVGLGLAVISDMLFFEPSLRNWDDNIWFQMIFLCFHIFFAVWILIGYRTRLATIMLWTLIVSLHLRTMSMKASMMNPLMLTLIWSIFLPLDRYWSWDRDQYATMTENFTITQVLSLATVAYILQLALIYSSGMQMMSGAYLLIGLLGFLFLVFPFFNTPSRFVGLIILTALYAVTQTHTGISFFILIVSLIPFLPGYFWEKMIPWFAPAGSATIYYDNHCGFCTRFIRALKNFGTFYGMSFIGITEAEEPIRKLSEESGMWVVERNQKFTLGYAAFSEMTRQSWLFRVYGYIGMIWPIRIIGESINRIISEKRKYCSFPIPVRQMESSSWENIASAIVICISFLSMSVSIWR